MHSPYIKPFALLSLAVFAACSSGAGSSLPAAPIAPVISSHSPALSDDDTVPFTPGVDAAPDVALTSFARRPLSLEETANVAKFSAQLGDPNRSVRHRSGLTPHNVVAGGNGEAVGLFSGPPMAGATGSIVNMGVQPNYHVTNGGIFYHTSIFVNNECFEIGVSYSASDATLFGYNWCANGNTPQGWINVALLGYPGGVLKNWAANGNGALIAWDSVMGQPKIAVEEVQAKDGWHALAYNWTTKKYIDIMNSKGVTGTNTLGGGWSVMELHDTPGASCAFDPTFAKGTHLLYGKKMQAMVNGQWKPIVQYPQGGWSSRTQMDCADITGTLNPSDVSPFFSGEFFSTATSTDAYGDYWLTQR